MVHCIGSALCLRACSPLVQYYAACWLNPDTVLAGGTQEPTAVAVGTKADKVGSCEDTCCGCRICVASYTGSLQNESRKGSQRSGYKARVCFCGLQEV